MRLDSPRRSKEERLEQTETKETFGAKWSRWGVNKYIAGIIVGAIAIVVSPYAMWNASAEKLAEERSSAAVLSALTPVCVARASNDPQYEIRVAELNSAPSYSRTKIVEDFGWSQLPGIETANRRLAEACARGVLDALAGETV